MKNFINKEKTLIKQDIKREPGTMIGVIIVWSAIISIILFANNPAKADYTFNLTPPTEHNWQIYDIDRLAKAVARHETGNCTLGYGKEYNNCFGIKNGNTAPCKKIGRNRMCIYNTPQDSYVAFKKIWSRWYSGMPTLQKARKWSGNDNAVAWYNNVTNFYNEHI